VGGIMIADYFFIRRKNLVTDDLYSHKGIYNYTSGFNRSSIIALLLGIVPNIPGFLVTINVIEKNSVPEIIAHLYNYAWFVGFAVSFFVYLVLMKRKAA
jgi:NCS1 family nucleobase:cation symporter-1